MSGKWALLVQRHLPSHQGKDPLINCRSLCLLFLQLNNQSKFRQPRRAVQVRGCWLDVISDTINWHQQIVGGNILCLYITTAAVCLDLPWKTAATIFPPFFMYAIGSFTHVLMICIAQLQDGRRVQGRTQLINSDGKLSINNLRNKHHSGILLMFNCTQ